MGPVYSHKCWRKKKYCLFLSLLIYCCSPFIKQFSSTVSACTLCLRVCSLTDQSCHLSRSYMIGNVLITRTLVVSISSLKVFCFSDISLYFVQILINYIANFVLLSVWKSSHRYYAAKASSLDKLELLKAKCFWNSFPCLKEKYF